MAKSMYSLMLSDDIINMIDELADNESLTRSSYINRVLAEHLNILTPEMQIANLYSKIEELFEISDIFTPYCDQNSSCLSLKSTIEYKYKPTIRYEFIIPKNTNDDKIGELRISFRTQSNELLREIENYFEAFSSIEKDYKYLNNIYSPNEYTFENNRFVKTLYNSTNKTLNDEYISIAIGEYIKMIDKTLKQYISTSYSATDMYFDYIKNINKFLYII